MTKSKTVGILGGMGPYATVSFFRTLLDLTPAKKDWEHLRLIIDNNPHIPSRSRYLLYGEESPVDGMIASCRKLQHYPVDFIVIPCNSACYFLPEVEKHVDVPILNIVEITAQSLNLEDGEKVAVFGGTITHEKETYRKFLEEYGFTYVEHSDEVQSIVNEIIELIKLNASNEEVVEKFYDAITELSYIDQLILGCTELSELKYTNDCGFLMVDSTEELAKKTVEIAFS